METLISFIIPVRHPENAENWTRLKSNLLQTVKSISAQTDKRWKGVVVANYGADLPALPSGFDVVRVDFPPNPNYHLSAENREIAYEAVRLDKGRRILAGMLHNRTSKFFMVVDDDDFVHNGLVEYVGSAPSSNGWRFNDGYVWGDGGRLLILEKDFNNLCGTSLIVRSDLYDLPSEIETASDDFIKTMLGSHVMISQILADQGKALAPLPFIGAIYRVGHAGTHSKSKTLIRKYIFNKTLAKHPAILLRNLLRLRLLNRQIMRTYFGE